MTSGAAWLTVRSSSSTRPSAVTSNGDRATGITAMSAKTRGASVSKPAAVLLTSARMMLCTSSDT